MCWEQNEVTYLSPSSARANSPSRRSLNLYFGGAWMVGAWLLSDLEVMSCLAWKLWGETVDLDHRDAVWLVVSTNTVVLSNWRLECVVTVHRYLSAHSPSSIFKLSLFSELIHMVFRQLFCYGVTPSVNVPTSQCQFANNTTTWVQPLMLTFKLQLDFS